MRVLELIEPCDACGRTAQVELCESCELLACEPCRVGAECCWTVTDGTLSTCCGERLVRGACGRCQQREVA